MNIGYVRVSTVSQNTDRQLDALGFCDKVYVDKKSGKNANRPGLKNALAALNEGDTLWVTELARLGRSLPDLCDISKVIMGKGADLKTLKNEVDLRNPTGVFTFQVIAAVAELERALIRERQMEGILAARARGKKWGNEKIYAADKVAEDGIFRNYYEGMVGFDDSVLLMGGISRTQFYRRYKAWRVENGIDG